jgi:hypothetical protein
MAAISLMQNLLLEPPTDEPEETLALDLSAPIAPSETPQGRRSRANSTRRPRKPSLTSVSSLFPPFAPGSPSD